MSAVDVIDDKKLAEWQVACDNAPVGPLEVVEIEFSITQRWSVEGPREPCTALKPYTSWPVFAKCGSKDAADFIAVAREALPEAIAEIRRLRALVARQNEALK